MLVDVPSSFKSPSGRWIHRIRQSDVSRFRMCPEQHRRHMLDLSPRWQNDSAALGTAGHTYFQHRLCGEPRDKAYGDAEAELRDLYAQPNIRTVQILGGLPEALENLGHVCITWDRLVLPTFVQAIPGIVGIEKQFEHLVYRDKVREIRICGTRDLDWAAVENHETETWNYPVWDWKTSNQHYSGYDAWIHKRYDVQPTMYLWARVLESADTVEYQLPKDYKAKYSLVYKVIHREPQGTKKGPRLTDELEVTRTWYDFEALLEEMKGMCYLIEAGLPQWPLRPTDWHCSNKWCEAWEDCRGKHLGDDPYNLMAKVQEGVDKAEVKWPGLDTVNDDPFSGLPN